MKTLYDKELYKISKDKIHPLKVIIRKKEDINLLNNTIKIVIIEVGYPFTYLSNITFPDSVEMIIFRDSENENFLDEMNSDLYIDNIKWPPNLKYVSFLFRVIKINTKFINTLPNTIEVLFIDAISTPFFKYLNKYEEGNPNEIILPESLKCLAIFFAFYHPYSETNKYCDIENINFPKKLEQLWMDTVNKEITDKIQFPLSFKLLSLSDYKFHNLDVNVNPIQLSISNMMDLRNISNKVNKLYIENLQFSLSNLPISIQKIIICQEDNNIEKIYNSKLPFNCKIKEVLIDPFTKLFNINYI